MHAQMPPNSWIIMFVSGKFALLTSTLAAVDKWKDIKKSRSDIRIWKVAAVSLAIVVSYTAL